MPSAVWGELKRALGHRDARVGLKSQLPYKRAFLREIEIFKDLSHEDMVWLEGNTRMTTAGKGQVLYHQEDRAEGLLLLKKGKVRISRVSVGGKKLELEILEPGTFFGEMPLLGQRMRSASAEALEDCTLCVMSQADIEALILSKPQVALRMLDILGRRLAESEARLEDLAYRSVPARLASVLLRLGAENGDAIAGLTHQDLGDMVGAYRETITKILDEFQAAGYVRLARRRIRVLDRRGLAAVLEQS